MAKLCVALDTTLQQAKELIRALRGYPLLFKVGYRLFISHHRAITDVVKEEGFELFLDLKLHDIPNTVKDGVISARELGADYLTVHTLSGREALRSAVEVKGKTRLLGVTLLTSLAEEDLSDVGLCSGRQELVLRLAQLALDAGFDGIVCSGNEVRPLKEGIKKPFLAVVPGVRLEGEPTEDQKKAVSLQFALEAGADIIVMGRSLLRADNPIKKIEEVLLIIMG